MEFSWSTFIIVILVIIVIYFVWTIMASSSSNTVMSGSQDAKTQTSVSIPDNSYSFAISTWIYVTDWESTNGDKVIISSESDSKKNPNLLISLDKDNNTLNITLGSDGKNVIPPVPNIPLQTWVSIILNVNNGSSVDIYINGKLVQTNALQGQWSLSAGSLYVGSKNGFDGYITMATFHKGPLAPQDAWDTYSSGYGSSGGSSAVDFFNKYKVRFAFVKDNVELSRLDI
jgi:uncharacterized protein (UPF0333 family)